MKDQSEFQQFLRRQGKKAHVVAGLVEQVRQFEAYLKKERHKELEMAPRP